MVEIFAFLVIAFVVMVLTMPLIPGIQRKRAIRKFEENAERDREEAQRKAQHNNYLKEQAKKLTPGYAVRRDGRIKKIPTKYLYALKVPNDPFLPDHLRKLKWEFFEEYPYFKR